MHRHLQRVIRNHIQPGTTITRWPLDPLLGLKSSETPLPLVQVLQRHLQPHSSADKAALHNDLGGVVPLFTHQQRLTAAHLNSDALHWIREPEEFDYLHFVDHSCLLNHSMDQVALDPPPCTVPDDSFLEHMRESP